MDEAITRYDVGRSLRARRRDGRRAGRPRARAPTTSARVRARQAFEDALLRRRRRCPPSTASSTAELSALGDSAPRSRRTRWRARRSATRPPSGTGSPGVAPAEHLEQRRPRRQAADRRVRRVRRRRGRGPGRRRPTTTMRASGSVHLEHRGAARPAALPDLEGLAQGGGVAQAGEHLVVVLDRRPPEREHDVALVHPAVPERVVGDQLQRARGPAAPPPRASQPASSSASMTRRASPRCSRGTPRGCPRPACPASCRRAGRATPPDRRQPGTGWARRPRPGDRERPEPVGADQVGDDVLHASTRRSGSGAATRRR